MREAAKSGLDLSELLFPLMNLSASVLANTVVHNGLCPNGEIEVVRHQLDQLFTQYLDAYRKQKA